VFGLGFLRQRCANAKAMHCVIDAARSRRLNDPANRAIAAAVAIFGGLDHIVSFVFGGALFGCFGPGAQHGVWKSSVTDFVGMAACTNSPDSMIRLAVRMFLSPLPIGRHQQGSQDHRVMWQRWEEGTFPAH